MEFHCIVKDKLDFHCRKIEVNTIQNCDVAHPIRVREKLEKGKRVYVINCDGTLFDSETYGAKFIIKAAKHIRDNERIAKQYRLAFVSSVDLDIAALGLKNAQQLSTARLIKYKIKFEEKLNQALDTVSPKNKT